MRSHLASVVVVVCVAMGGGCGSKRPVAGELLVSGTPTGDILGNARVVLAFTRPMVAADRVGQVEAAPPLKIEPPIAGQASWADDKTLVLVPAAALPTSTKFVATVPGATRALDQSTLGVAATFEFTTRRIDGALEIVDNAERTGKSPQVKAAFVQDVAPAELEKRCRFVSPGGKQAIKLVGDDVTAASTTFLFTPASELAADTEYKVVCDAGLRGVEGNLGTAEAMSADLKTHGPLRFVKNDPAGNDIVPQEGMHLDLAFSNPLAPPYRLTIEPAVPGFPQRCHDLGLDPAGLSCSATLEPHTTYTVTVGKDQRDIFGQELGTEQVLTLHTTDAEPTVSVETGYFLAELTRPELPVWTRNVKELTVTAVAITPENFHQLRPKLDWWDSTPADLKGTRLVAKTQKLAVAGAKNAWTQQRLSARELVGATPGPGTYYVEIGAPEAKGRFADGGRAKILVNFTDLGVVSKLSPTQGTVWATRLSTGKPLAGAAVSVRASDGHVTWTGTTDDRGVAVLPGRAKLEGKRPKPAAAAEGEEEESEEEDYESGLRVYVAHEGDWTMVNPTASGGLSPWNYDVEVDWDQAPARLRGFMHTDRGLYRAGDTVHVKGLARVTRLGAPLAPPPAGKPVEVEVEGPHGKTVMTAKAKLSPFGGFWFDLELPADARLGDYQIRAKLEHGSFARSFSVEAYRPATFEVGSKLVSKGPVVRKGQIKAEINASYLYGAPLRAGDVAVAVHSRPRRVSFDKYPDHQFIDERRYRRWSDESEYSQLLVTEQELTLDAAGKANLAFTVGPDDVVVDADLLVRASVTAPSNEVINKSFVVPYFHSKRYFGIKAPGYFLDVGKPQKFEIVALAPDGKVAAGAAKVTVTRRDWNCVWEDWGYRGSYRCDDTTKTVLEETVTPGVGAPAAVTFTPEGGGEYWIIVEGVADKDNAAAAAMNLYAWGDGGGSWQSSDALSFEVIADKKKYAAGDTAVLLLKTDLSQASGLVTIERDGVIEQQLIEVTPTQKTIELPITAAYAPNVYVSVALVQGRMGDGPRGKPRMRMGLVNLPVRPVDDRLKVEVVTDHKDYRPGAKVTATVKVTDRAGKPVAAEVAITAADEGVLSLIGYQTPDPVPTFWAAWGLGVTTATQLEFLRDIPPPGLDRPATGGDAAGTLRSRFIATAVWVPGAVTDKTGTARVEFIAPDNLTAFRVMAVAADKGQRFGSAEQRFTVSKPLQLHAALPRFVNVGDKVSAGVVVHNETGADGTAEVTMVSDARLPTSGATTRSVAVAKGAAVPVMFELTGAAVGPSALTFAVTMGSERDGLAVTVPVRHPSPLETTDIAHAASRARVEVPVKLPDGALPGAELVISVDPDGLAGIEDGLRDLVGYPYGCLEQTTSKMIPMLAVRELTQSLDLLSLTGTNLEGFVKIAIGKIGRHQTSGGGFSLWPGGEAEAYYTAYALWGLHLAKQAGYQVDEARIDDALAYLREDGKHPDTSDHYYDAHGDLGSQAFALYVRAVLGDQDTAAATELLAKGAEVPVFGRAFLARAIAVHLGARDPAVVKLVGQLETLAIAAGDKLIEDPLDDGGYYMGGPLRTTAAVLAALVELDPKHPANAAMVRTIMASRRGQTYLDTQENLYSLVALTSYARTVAAAAPSVAITIGGAPLFDGTLTGQGRVQTFTTPLPAGTTVALTPRGEVHYQVSVRYRRAVAALTGQARGGVTLTREYRDDQGRPATKFKVGDVIVVRLATHLPEAVPHLMISDALPAGFEALNTRLATVGTAGIKESESWDTYRELYDDRVDFASLWGERGDVVHEYSIRATTAGTFIRPPALATLMYEPATGAQTAADTLVIEAR